MILKYFDFATNVKYFASTLDFPYIAFFVNYKIRSVSAIMQLVLLTAVLNQDHIKQYDMTLAILMDIS